MVPLPTTENKTKMDKMGGVQAADFNFNVENQLES